MSEQILRAKFLSYPQLVPPSEKATKPNLQGPKIEIVESYGGLGSCFLDALLKNMTKIHQMDTVTGITETCGSVRTRAIDLCLELLKFHLVDNDIILICSRCHADQTVVVLACLSIGCIVAPIDSELHHKECVELVTQLKPKMCFCDLRALKRIERVVIETGITMKLVHFGDQQQYAIPFRKLLMTKRPKSEFTPVNIEQPKKRVAFILATQGSCGNPRLVCLSHHFLYTQVQIISKALNTPKKILSYYPLSWVIEVILMCFCFMTPVIRVLPGAFAERTTCKLIQDLQIDYAFLNTDLTLQLVEDGAVRDFNLSCLKYVFIGSLATIPNDIKRLISRLPKTKFTQLFCTTETGIAIACPPKDYSESLERIGTVGRVVQNCSVRIVDIETRRDVEVETSGELLVASDCMMLGYFKDLEATKNCLQDGYFKTGDLAKYDADGWVFLEGSISELINVRGFRESPRALEDAISMHPYVKDTAVVSDENEVVACVIVKPNTNLNGDKLATFLAERLPVKNLPSRILFMENFPTTPIGRIRRDLLKDQIFTIKIEHNDSF